MSQQIDCGYFDWDTHTEIARGPDSIVYHDSNDPDQVIKRYRHRPLEVVQAYASLTNRASDLLEKEQCYGFLSAKKGSIPLYGIDFRVNPVRNVMIDQQGKPVAYSKYIPGPMPINHGPYNKSWHWNRSLNQLDPAEQAKLNEMAALYEADCYESFHYYHLNEYLNDQLDVYQMNIEGGNVKIRFDLETQRLRLIVTDLTKYFGNIHDIWPNNEPPETFLESRLVIHLGSAIPTIAT